MTLEDRAEQGFTTDQDVDTDSPATTDERTEGLTPDALLVDHAPPQATVVAPAGAGLGHRWSMSPTSPCSTSGPVRASARVPLPALRAPDA